jgi:hypothetical protein
VPLRELPLPPSGRIVLVIAQMFGHLRIQGPLQHILGQLAQQPVRADQLHTLVLGLSQQLFRELLLIQFRRHRLECFGHQ